MIFSKKKIPTVFMLLFIKLMMPIALCNSQAITQHIITVFVHGTSVARRMMDRSPFRPHVYCPQGLTLASKLPEKYRYHKIVKKCVQLNSEQYSLDNFYIFGWRSESFNHKTRMKAAQKLIESLQQVVTNYYKKYKVTPLVRLIGFSHGGNVVLNTAHFGPLLVEEKPLSVEAWLFATPVQRINHDLVNHKHFHKVYSVYSRRDWLQRIDPQGLANKKIRKTHFWSDRTFDQDAQCIQVKFTVNSQSISHLSYRPLFEYFPSIQNLIEQAADGLDSGMIEVDFIRS